MWRKSGKRGNYAKIKCLLLFIKKEISGDENLSSLIFYIMLIFIKDGVIILGYFKEEEK